MELNNRKTVQGWCFFDWANSAYALVITATIFPAYYNTVTKEAFQGEMVSFLGFPMNNTVLYSYALSFSFLIITVLSPFLSGIADYGGRKKPFMRFFTTLGSLACMSLFFFTGENIELGIIGTILASVGFTGSMVFYNAFLLEIVTPDRYDEVSAKGFTYGYIGSVTLLIVNLLMVQHPDWFMLPNAGFAARLSFLMVGVWWLAFSQITFQRLQDRFEHKTMISKKVLKMGIARLGTVIQEFKHLPNVQRFLLSFFCFNLGAQTILYLAPVFATKILKLDSSQLIIVALLLQIVGIGGAYLSSMLSERIGNIRTLLMVMAIWVVLCVGACNIQNAMQFYVLALFLGLVMGAVQSLSRSTYAKLLPENTTDFTSYYSFYDVMYQFSIVLGTFLFGYIEQITGSMRNSVLSMSLFFFIGGAVLLFVKIKRKPTLEDKINEIGVVTVER